MTPANESRNPTVNCEMDHLVLAVLGLAAPAKAIPLYTFLPPNGAGKAQFHPPRRIDPTAIGVPCGYYIEPVVTGLT